MPGQRPGIGRPVVQGLLRQGQLALLQPPSHPGLADTYAVAAARRQSRQPVLAYLLQQRPGAGIALGKQDGGQFQPCIVAVRMIATSCAAARSSHRPGSSLIATCWA